LRFRGAITQAGLDDLAGPVKVDPSVLDVRIVAWDEPGAGRSSDLPADFGLADYAHCLAALIEALALGPVNIAGLSSGGTVVQALYHHHPELVATLILAGTYAGWKGSLPEAEVHAA
jgi:pimeloyl-ACP methyl ester carboxylesterase